MILLCLYNIYQTKSTLYYKKYTYQNKNTFNQKPYIPEPNIAGAYESALVVLVLYALQIVDNVCKERLIMLHQWLSLYAKRIFRQFNFSIINAQTIFFYAFQIVDIYAKRD